MFAFRFTVFHEWSSGDSAVYRQQHRVTYGKFTDPIDAVERDNRRRLSRRQRGSVIRLQARICLQCAVLRIFSELYTATVRMSSTAVPSGSE
jgi:hypothetical protein